MSMDVAGLEQACAAFFCNDHFYLRPVRNTAADEALWAAFRERFLETSRKILGEDSEYGRLPGMLVKVGERVKHEKLIAPDKDNDHSGDPFMLLICKTTHTSILATCSTVYDEAEDIVQNTIRQFILESTPKLIVGGNAEGRPNARAECFALARSIIPGLPIVEEKDVYVPHPRFWHTSEKKDEHIPFGFCLYIQNVG
ncbi:hypothetical protein K458DRAFT_396891 [Lentithecium fluviatile CBS 122367]|uniref:DUF3669 domain-containing protein n=1 Tax=Lentithecium fluviatile CBS 122367 TaxID=1168545 RepID=A0A6G1IE16_9PLEO|nr:hypothetical protein K458DRAFT_396891 [Lentithecium fluviatile CBS 122367]